MIPFSISVMDYGSGKSAMDERVNRTVIFIFVHWINIIYIMYNNIYIIHDSLVVTYTEVKFKSILKDKQKTFIR